MYYIDYININVIQTKIINNNDDIKLINSFIDLAKISNIVIIIF